MSTTADTVAKGPLSFPAYRRVFLARGVSSAGSYMQIVASTWFAYSVTGSSTSVGVLTALALGPALVGGPIGGVLAERYDPKRLSIVLSLLQAVPAAVLAVLAVVGLLSMPWLYLLVFAGAIPFSLNQPVITLVVPATVPEDYRHAAVARSSMVYNVTRLLGSVIGGFIVQLFGVGFAFGFNAASYVTVALILVGTPLVSAITRRPRQSSAGIAAGVREGWAQRLVRIAALGVATFFTLIAPVEQLMPTVAQEHGKGASAVGILVGAIGLGALLANPLIGAGNRSAHGRRRLMATGLALAAPGIVLLAITPQHGLAIDIVGAVLIGFGWEFVFVSGQSTVAIEVGPDLRGRLMGLFFVLVTATTALGAVVLGWLMQQWGLTTVFLANAAAVLVAAAVILVVNNRLPEQDDSSASHRGADSA